MHAGLVCVKTVVISVQACFTRVINVFSEHLLLAMTFKCLRHANTDI